MTRLLLVCAGGALGSGARYLVSTWAALHLGAEFPRGTLVVNVTGSFALAFDCLRGDRSRIGPCSPPASGTYSGASSPSGESGVARVEYLSIPAGNVLFSINLGLFGDSSKGPSGYSFPAFGSLSQPGEIANVSRVRIRYEDGNEVSRQTESETLVRAPQKRIVGYGTKVEIKEAAVDGIQIQYWRAVQMFATAYSPCRSAPGQCYPSTASGKPVKRGVVALRTDLYMAMRGQPLYIPGYGRATVEDACGGCVGKPWIDLGYSDSDYQGWGRWVTVYFLTPVPSSIIYVLD